MSAETVKRHPGYYMITAQDTRLLENGLSSLINCLDEVQCPSRTGLRCVPVLTAELSGLGKVYTPRLCPSFQAQRCTYARWSTKPPIAPDTPPSLDSRLVPTPYGLPYASVRLLYPACYCGALDLRSPLAMPLPACPLGDFGDERHLTFVYPALQHIRNK